MTTRLIGLIASLICTAAGLAQTTKPAISVDVRSKLDAIEQEIDRRRGTGDARAAEMLAGELVKVHDLLNGKGRPRPAGPELHVVGMYGPKHWRTNEVVEVTITDRPIVLALCAYEPVRWELKLAAGATVDRVIIGGYHEQKFIWSDANRPAPPLDTYTHEHRQRGYFYAYERGSEEFVKLKDTLKQLTQLDITTFQGAGKGTGGDPPHIVGPESPAWHAQVIEDQLEPLYREATALSRARASGELRTAPFVAIHYATEPPPPRVAPNGRRLPQHPLDAHSMPAMRAQFTLDGPIVESLQPLPQGAEQIAIDPQSKICYGITNHDVFRVDPATGKRVNIPVRGDVPRMSWLCGAAFDTKRQRLVVAARIQGQMCAYSPATDEWTFIAERERTHSGLQGLTYAAEDDCFYALESDLRDPARTRIRKIGPDGKLLDAVDLDVTFTRADGPTRQTQLATLDGGRKLAILIAPKPIGPQRVEPARCVAVDVKTGKVVAESTPRPIVAPAADFDAAEAHRLWRLLGSTDAAEADRASQRLRAGREVALAALKPRFDASAAASPPAAADRIAQLVKQLDDAEEVVRERATSDLIQAGPTVADALREAARQDLPAETQARLNLILADIAAPAAAERRNQRLIAVLAEVASPAAVEHLITLCGGPPDSPATQAARRALRQL